jgi:uncharacterized lipoprotein YddW (UPF0748 family)
MLIDTVVSHGDWFNGWGTYGAPSVYRILSEIKRAGVGKTYWRTFMGARAMYHSALEDVYSGDEQIDRPGNEAVFRMRYDLKSWDPLRDAVKTAGELNMPLIAWYSVYEESHYQNTTTRLALSNPELCWRTREGTVRKSKLSFASPAVRQHKLAIIDELLHYGVGGILLDFFREHHLYTVTAPRVEVDGDGVCIYGYEQVMLDAFRRQFDLDPLTLRNNDERWVRFRADQTTEFMRAVSKRARARNLPVSVKVRSMNPLRTSMWWKPEVAKTNSYLGSFVDWPTWAREGLIDEVMIIMENWDLFDLDHEKLWAETESARKLVPSPVKLSVGFFMNNMNDRPVIDGERWLKRCATAAALAGADAVCLWESTGIHAWGSGRGGGTGTSIGLWSEIRRLTS